MHENAPTAGNRTAGAGRLGQTGKSFVALWILPCGREHVKRSEFDKQTKTDTDNGMVVTKGKGLWGGR